MGKSSYLCERCQHRGSSLCVACSNGEFFAEYSGSRMSKYDTMYIKKSEVKVTQCFVPEIKNVIFSDPATIIQWADGTKTVVKCQPNDIYDPEKGMAMAIAKKALGNKGNFNEVFKKWLPKEEEVKAQTVIGTVREVDIRDEGLFASVNLNPSLIGDKLTEAIKEATTSTMSISFEAKKGV